MRCGAAVGVTWAYTQGKLRKKLTDEQTTDVCLSIWRVEAVLPAGGAEEISVEKWAKIQ